METTAIAFAFSAGMLASVNPCGFAMLPTFITYYLGGTDENTDDEHDLNARMLQALWFGVLVTGGFLLVFLVTGLVMTAGGRLLISVAPWLGIVVGITLIGVGVYYLLGKNLPVTIPIPQWDVKTTGVRGMFLYGVAYALASLSCTLPIFLSVFAGSLASDGWGATIVLFVAYSLGMGTVISTLALATALFQNTMAQYLRKTMRYVKLVSSVALIAAGMYLVYYQVSLNPLL